MSIPANALSDEECLHYAALDTAAAAELTRRLTNHSTARAWLAKKAMPKILTANRWCGPFYS